MGRMRWNLDAIRDVLETGGYPCQRIAEDTLRSLIQGKHASFPFFVRLDPKGFLVFAIVPYLRSPEDEERAARFYERLLELNQSLLMAKFSIDDDLDVMLSVEYALPDLDRSEFDDALDVLAYYADRHYDELRTLGVVAQRPAARDSVVPPSAEGAEIAAREGAAAAARDSAPPRGDV